MSGSLRTTPVVLFLLLLVPACSTPPLRIESDFVPVGSLRVAQVVQVAKRDEILKAEVLYKAMIAAGVSDSDLEDGSVVVARIYCCGGPTRELSAEYANARMLYVPKGTKTGLGDFVEVKVGRPPKQGDGGFLNIVTRVVSKNGDQQPSCWWDPRNESLWLRVAYCDWMPKEGWVKRGGTSPAWFKRAP